MPICQTCHGTGQKESIQPQTITCPDCGGSKRLPDGSKCLRCKQTGEIPSGKVKTIKELCDTCWGSGEVSQQYVTTWFLVRTAPASLGIFALGGGLIWAAWSFVGSVPLTASLIILTLASWGGVIAYFIPAMLKFGSVPPTAWFILRATMATLLIFGIGGAIMWLLTALITDLRIVGLVGLIIFTLWGIVMFFLISDLPSE